MNFFILILVLCLFIFLFALHFLAEDDFVLTRRDISLEKLFNIVFIICGVALFFSRFFYGVFISKSIFANPFLFLLFPYYPGLSLLGGIVGGLIALFLWQSKDASFPRLRLFDFFSSALLCVLPIGFFGYFAMAGDSVLSLKPIFILLTYLALVILAMIFIFPKLMEGKIKDGTAGFIFLTSFSFISLISHTLVKFNFLNYFKNLENIALLVMFFTSLILLFRQESLWTKIMEIRKKYQN